MYFPIKIIQYIKKYEINYLFYLDVTKCYKAIIFLAKRSSF